MTGGVSPVSRVVLREQVKDVLLRRILDGTYVPGGRLVETRIADELGTSQAPVREALRDLEQLGLVVHEPFRGCSVRELSIDALLEAFPVRASLEGLAARLAAERITEPQLEHLAELIETMRRGEAGDHREVSVADAAFHETIVEAADNATLDRLWRQLQPRARTFITLVLPASPHGSTADRHVPILEALRAGAQEAAEHAMQQHLADAAERLRLLADPASDEPATSPPTHQEIS
jgi:DNA-binding GntR family transcriptional regulator